MSNYRAPLIGDIVRTPSGQLGLVVGIHENEYGIFYNIVVDNELIVVSDQEVTMGVCDVSSES